MSKFEQDGVIIEFIPRGNVVKVSAIDMATGTEVSIVGDAKATEKELQRLAIKKLEYVMNKKKNVPANRDTGLKKEKPLIANLDDINFDD